MKVDVNSDITEAASKVQDAVVSVINLQKQQSQSGLGGFSDIFGNRNDDQQSQDDSGQLEEASEGSGVIYKLEGNTAYIVTNNHVVENKMAWKYC